MNRLIKILCVCLISISIGATFSSCNGAKAYVKKAQKMEEAGATWKASQHYFTALSKKPDNVDALIGLKRAGQIILSRYLAKFDEAQLYGNREEAIKQFQNAEIYYSNVARVGVTLAFPQAKRTLFEAVKNAHVEEIYVEANEHLELNNYYDAQILFEQIEELVPGFKDADLLGDYAFCKPTYEIADKAMVDGRYRTAYKLFNSVVHRDDSYKDAANRKAEALETGLFTIALMKFENGSNKNNIHTKVSSYVEQKLMSSSDIFLKVVDRESIEMILQEQQLELSGLTSGAELEVGSLLGAKAILKGTVVECFTNKSQLRYETKKGFEEYRVQKINPENGKKYYVKKYRPATYREYTRDSNTKITLSIKLVSMETGTVLSSATVNASQTDKVKYATYNGNNNSLYPENVLGQVDLYGTKRTKLQSLLNSRQSLLNESVLIDNCAKTISSKVLTEVELILHDLIK
jgi:curli biogenesis system outer membrane secretion channel CsgG